MKEFWLEPSQDLPSDAVRKLVEASNPDAILLLHGQTSVEGRIAANKAGADILVTSDPGEAASAKAAGATIALECTIRNKEDHNRIIQSLELRPDYLLIACPDWKVIPLENLVAEAGGRSKILARTSSFEESKTAIQILELGVDGVALSSQDVQEIVKTRQLLAQEQPLVSLTRANVTRVKVIGTGARVCVDTCEIIRSREGLLTGCSSRALFLVEGEVTRTRHVNPRPFRVNAGPVSLYVLTSDGKTCYLSELSAGDSVLLVDEDGRSRLTDVARVKIERRPMVLVEAETEGLIVKTILQNAETVRLTIPNGSTPVSELKPGDQVLVRLEEGGRHFGTRVPEEMILER
jgi:3-dehydroquinate synthase II